MIGKILGYEEAKIVEHVESKGQVRPLNVHPKIN
jgi:hypothetical protein